MKQQQSWNANYIYDFRYIPAGITYSMVAILDSRSQKLFQMDAQTGAITTASRLDREAMDVHYLRVIAATGAFSSTFVNLTLFYSSDPICWSLILSKVIVSIIMPISITIIRTGYHLRMIHESIRNWIIGSVECKFKVICWSN